MRWVVRLIAQVLIRMVRGKVVRVMCGMVSRWTRRLVSRMGYSGWLVCRTLIVGVVFFFTPRVAVIEFFIVKISRIA